MHIILYVFDALRADHLGCYGYERGVSPRIDQVAKGGVVFNNCFTSTTWTRPVAASILTGVYPGVHLTRSRYDTFHTPLMRLSEVLQQGGFKTAAFATMGNIAGDIGFERGFDVYHDLFAEPEIMARRHKLNAAKEGMLNAPLAEIALPLAEDINPYLFGWLDAHRTDDTFSFIWSIETHEPYRAPESFRRFSQQPLRAGEGESDDIRASGPADRRRLQDRYDDEIYYNDHCLGQIVDYLESVDIYDDTLLVIASDHGEAFYDHGVYTHGSTPFEELIHVPLIIKFPGSQHAGSRIGALAELIDIFPTLVAVAGLSMPETDSSVVQGRSLLPLIEGTQKAVREYVFSDTQSLSVHNRYLSIRDQRWKYIQIKRPPRDAGTMLSAMKHILERGLLLDVLRRPRHFLRKRRQGADEYLFDLESDPGERHNLVAREPEKVRQLQRQLEEWQQQNETLARQSGDASHDYEESETLRRHLERLGYM